VKGLSAPPAPGAQGGKKQDSFQNDDDDESGDGDGSDEDGSGSGDGKNKNKRRSKNDVDGRDFKCKYCDKTYLSYPALYTHMKQKHAKGPDGEMRTPPTSGRGRGRPRKNVSLLECSKYTFSLTKELTQRLMSISNQWRERVDLWTL
jgi:hypothetical protein